MLNLLTSMILKAILLDCNSNKATRSVSMPNNLVDAAIEVCARFHERLEHEEQLKEQLLQKDSRIALLEAQVDYHKTRATRLEAA